MANGIYSYSHSQPTFTLTVATTGVYDITAFGAQGGASGSATGGNGAEAGGDFMLTAGTQLTLFVGGMGASSGVGGGGGGGGGSFVVEDGTTPLLIAGGGGGAFAAGNIAYGGVPGSISLSGTAGTGTSAGAGGASGLGGTFGYFLSNGKTYAGGGGGGGFLGGGAGDGPQGGGPYGGGYSAFATNGPRGGYIADGTHGGFGGGGGGGGPLGNKIGGGGGGGYSGGGGGGRDGGAGGGGGSIDNASSGIVLKSDANAGNGLITISPAIVCYLRGTCILTLTGEVPIENLRIGDRVVTATGLARPVRWLGRRAVNCGGHPDPQSVWPVRIAAGAFAEAQPHHDLWVSPGHSIRVDDVLVQAEFSAQRRHDHAGDTRSHRILARRA